MKEFFSNFWNSLAAKSCLLTLALLLVGTGMAPAQPIAIRGTVTDESGSPLVGVGVVVENTNKGTTTDIRGNYVIEAPQGSTITYSFIGMTTQKATVRGGGISHRHHA